MPVGNVKLKHEKFSWKVKFNRRNNKHVCYWWNPLARKTTTSDDENNNANDNDGDNDNENAQLKN